MFLFGLSLEPVATLLVFLAKFEHPDMLGVVLMDGLQKENEVNYQDGCGLLKTLEGSDVRNASSPKVLRAFQLGRQ